ncbi:Uncharacterised protein [Acinetobacter baumannii]|nr:Uncharacterised protein [Acinetobacter baumannii]
MEEPLNYYKKMPLKLNVAPVEKFKLPTLEHVVLVQISNWKGLNKALTYLISFVNPMWMWL